MSNRWWGPRSDFAWEEDALRHIEEQLPQAEPYRGWHTFTFTAKSGHVREVDLFIATPGGLFLVEIKSHPGRAINSGNTWLFHGHDRVRSIENPLHLTDLKCKQLKEQLEWAVKQLDIRGLRIPYIAPAVFLSAPDLRCAFDDVQKTRVFGRDKLTGQTGLPGIWEGLLGRPPRSARDAVDPRLSRQLHKLLTKIGVSGLRRHRKVGPFELAPKAFDAGPTWEDYLAENTALPGDQPRRIRIYLSELRAGTAERESTRRAARREYLALQGISHDGIVHAEQFSDEHEAGPSIIFRHGKDWRRLDHFMAERGPELEIETRVEMLRQLAEALDHAHRRHLYHRALAARSVYVELDGYYPRLRICDWQVSARPSSGSSGRPSAVASSGVTSLGAHVEGSAGPYLAPEFGNAEAEGTQLDVFGLGAIGHLILTGRAPADGRPGLAQRLAAEHALVPSAMADEISPVMDELIRTATRVQPVDRFDSVRDFLSILELVEEELTDPGDTDVPDLLEATKGSTVDGWEVAAVLGKGSTAKALLVTRDGHEQVLKVALNAAARDRLAHEAAQLHPLRSQHIVRYIDGPIEIGDRHALVLERAGEQTLAQYLKQEGRLTIDELDRLGGHLFQAVEYLEEQGIWHRDIKPDNLAIKQLAKSKKGSRLVLFDFSLAGAAEAATEAGTPPYLDPFLGTDRRPVYDAAAERYAVAVTLHEMAAAELPSWGDGIVEPKLLPSSEQLPQLAEDSFDPLLRDRLVSFFRIALHRDPARRHASRRQMAQAWADIFRDLDAAPPPTTSRTVRGQSRDPEQARRQAVAEVTAMTSLAAAGLSTRAQSIAFQQLDVSTVGELVKIPAARIQRLRGVGLGPRNELVMRAREWRAQLEVAEQVAEVAKAERAEPDTDLARLTLDEVAALLVPRAEETAVVRVVRLALALPDAAGRPSPVPAWAPLATIAEHVEGLGAPDVGTLLGKARERWTRNVKAVTALRRTVLEILDRHGRVMEARQLAAALLAERGSGLDDTRARLALAEGCLRAAIETEEHVENPLLAKRRTGDRVVVAAVAEDDPSAPTEEELLDYAVKLGDRADRLVDLPDAAPLPSVAAVRAALHEEPRPDGMPQLSDTDLVSLAAGASRNAAVTARLELYPRDLDAAKALRLVQVASYLGGTGIEPSVLVSRVRARFPELTGLPDDPTELFRLLKERLGYNVQYERESTQVVRFVLPGGKVTSGWPSPVKPSRLTATGTAPADKVTRRLHQAAERGGYLAVKASFDDTAAVRAAVGALPSVTPLHVTDLFVATLRQVVTSYGGPRWETVLAADADEVSPAAKAGFGKLLGEVWQEFEERIRAARGTVLLHDATPLARYSGGMELLYRLAASARQPDESPHGLWLLCPMADPHRAAILDGSPTGAVGEHEQFAVPRGFATEYDTRRVS